MALLVLIHVIRSEVYAHGAIGRLDHAAFVQELLRPLARGTAIDLQALAVSSIIVWNVHAKFPIRALMHDLVITQQPLLPILWVLGVAGRHLKLGAFPKQIVRDPEAAARALRSDDGPRALHGRGCRCARSLLHLRHVIPAFPTWAFAALEKHC